MLAAVTGKDEIVRLTDRLAGLEAENRALRLMRDRVLEMVARKAVQMLDRRSG